MFLLFAALFVTRNCALSDYNRSLEVRHYY